MVGRPIPTAPLVPGTVPPPEPSDCPKPQESCPPNRGPAAVASVEEGAAGCRTTPFIDQQRRGEIREIGINSLIDQTLVRGTERACPTRRNPAAV